MEKEQIIKLIMDHKKIILKVGLGILLFLMALVAYIHQQISGQNEVMILPEAETNPPYTQERAALAEKEEEKDIIVDIDGAVQRPGIVKLKEGSRVYDAVEGAGGLLATANTSDVNLAAHLSDGDKIFIPAASDSPERPARAGIVTGSVSKGTVGQNQPSFQENGLVNLNQATSEQLQTLSGVGPATAQKIIDHREKVGGFKRIEELMDVSGIGAKTFEKLKDKIMV